MWAVQSAHKMLTASQCSMCMGVCVCVFGWSSRDVTAHNSPDSYMNVLGHMQAYTGQVWQLFFLDKIFKNADIVNNGTGLES